MDGSSGGGGCGDDGGPACPLRAKDRNFDSRSEIESFEGRETSLLSLSCRHSDMQILFN